MLAILACAVIDNEMLENSLYLILEALVKKVFGTHNVVFADKFRTSDWYSV